MLLWQPALLRPGLSTPEAPSRELEANTSPWHLTGVTATAPLVIPQGLYMKDMADLRPLTPGYLDIECGGVRPKQNSSPAADCERFSTTAARVAAIC